MSGEFGEIFGEEEEARLRARASLVAAGELPAGDLARARELAAELGVSEEVARVIPEDMAAEARARKLAGMPKALALAERGPRDAALLRDNAEWLAEAAERIEKDREEGTLARAAGAGTGTLEFMKNMGKSFYNGLLDVTRWHYQFALAAAEAGAALKDGDMKAFSAYEWRPEGGFFGEPPAGAFGGGEEIGGVGDRGESGAGPDNLEKGGSGAGSNSLRAGEKGAEPEIPGETASGAGIDYSEKEGRGGEDLENEGEGEGSDSLYGGEKGGGDPESPAAGEKGGAARSDEAGKAIEPGADASIRWLKERIRENEAMRFEVRADNAVSGFAHDVARNLPQFLINMAMFFAPGLAAGGALGGAAGTVGATGAGLAGGAFGAYGGAAAAAEGGFLASAKAAALGLLSGAGKSGYAAGASGLRSGFRVGFDAGGKLGPAFAGTDAYIQIGGASYEELRKRGVSPKEALFGASLDAAGQTPLEYLGARTGFNLFRGAERGIMAAVGKGATAEGITEFLQKWPEYLGHTWAETSKESDDFGDRLEMFSRRLVDSERLVNAALEGIYEGMIGAVTGGTVGGASRGARKLFSGKEEALFEENRKATAAALARGRLTEALAAIGEKRPANLDAAAGRELAATILPEEFATTWLAPEDLGALLTENRHNPGPLLAALGKSADEVNEAMAAAAPLPVDTARIAGTEDRFGVADRLLPSPEGFTRERAEAWNMAGTVFEQARILFSRADEDFGGEEAGSGATPPAVIRAANEARREADVKRNLEIELTRVRKELRRLAVSEPEIREFTELARRRALAAYAAYGLDPAFNVNQRLNFVRGEELAPGLAREETADTWDRLEGESEEEWFERLNGLIVRMPGEEEAAFFARMRELLPEYHPFFYDADLGTNYPEWAQGEGESRAAWFERLNGLIARFPGESEADFRDRMKEALPADHPWRVAPAEEEIFGEEEAGESPAEERGREEAGDSPGGEGKGRRRARAGAVRGLVILKGWAAKIGIFRGRTPATVLHEASHAWFDDLIRVARDDGSMAMNLLENQLGFLREEGRGEALAAWREEREAGGAALDIVAAFSERLKGMREDALARIEAIEAERKRMAAERPGLEGTGEPHGDGEYVALGEESVRLRALAKVLARARVRASEARRRLLAIPKAEADVREFCALAGLNEAETAEVLVADGERELAGDGEDAYGRMQEAAARALMDYLIEGKAPSRNLLGAFGRFSKWLRALYAGAPLPEGVRDAFDRMFATPAEINQRAWLDRISEAEEAFLATTRISERSKLSRLFEKARAEVRDLTSLNEAEARRKRRDRLIGIYSKRISKEPVWRAARAKYNREEVARLVGEAGAADLEAAGLNIVGGKVRKGADAVRYECEGSWDSTEDMFEDLRERLVVRGESVERLAAEAAEEELAAGDMDLNAATAASFSEAFGDYLQAVQEAAWLEIFEGSASRDAAKLRARNVSVGREVYEASARERLRTTPLAEIQSGRWRRALDSALTERGRAMVAGDRRGVLDAIDRARVAVAMIHEAELAAASYSRLRKEAAKAAAVKQGTYGDEFGYAVRVLLGSLNLARPRWNPDPGRAGTSVGEILERNFDPEELVANAPLFPEWLKKLNWNPGRDQPAHTWPMAALTPEMIAEASALLAFLTRGGRADVKARREAERKREEELAFAAAEGMASLPDYTAPSAYSARGKLGRSLERFFSAMDALRWQVKMGDGMVSVLGDKKGAVGPLEDFFNKEIMAAEARIKNRRAMLQELLLPHIAVLGKMVKRLEREHGKWLKDVDGRVIEAPEGIRKAYGTRGFTPDMLIAVALNCGADSNMSRLARGYAADGLTREALAALVGDEMAERAFRVARFEEGKTAEPYRGPRRDGLLTADEWRAIQGVWDALHSQWADTCRAHEELYGFLPLAVPVSPRVIEIGGEKITLNGGYYPVKYDGEQSARVAAWTSEEELVARNDSLFNRPEANRGFTRARVASAPGLPVKLDTSVIASHIDDAVTFIEMARPAMSLDRITRDPLFRSQYERVYGKADYAAIRPNLTGLVRREPAPTRSNFMVSWANAVRPYLVAWGLSWNLKVAALQSTAIFSAMNDVGAAPVLRAMAYLSARPSAIKQIYAASPYLRSRLRQIDQDLSFAIKRTRPAAEKTVRIRGGEYSWSDLVDLGMKPIVWVDALTCGCVWLAAYNQKTTSLREGGVYGKKELFDFDDRFHAEAAAYANAIVKQGNPDYDASSRCAFLRSNDASRLFNSFSSAIVLYAQRSRYMALAREKGRLSLAGALRYNFYDFLAPGLAMGLFLALCQSVSPGEEPERLAALLAGTVADSFGMKVPVFGQIAADSLFFFFDLGRDANMRQGGYRTSLDAPLDIARGLVRSGKSAAKGKDDGPDRLAWSLFDAFSFMARVPFSKIARKGLDAAEQWRDFGPNPGAIVAPRGRNDKKDPEVWGLFR